METYSKTRRTSTKGNKISSLSPGRKSYESSGRGLRNSNIEDEELNGIHYVRDSPSHRIQEKFNVNNKLSQLQLEIISIFITKVKKGEEEKYIILKTPIGQKFVLKMCEENYFVSIDNRGDVHQYERHEGSFLPSDTDYNIPNLDKVLYTCGADGLCIMERDKNGPYQMNFIAKTHGGKESLMLEGSVIPYPLINLQELLIYDDENYHLLYKKINEQSCVIRRNFREVNIPLFNSLKNHIHGINKLFDCLCKDIKCIDEEIEEGCKMNLLCCDKFALTPYARLCEILQQKINMELIESNKHINCKAEKFYNAIRILINSEQEFTRLFECLTIIHESVEQLK